MTKTREPESRAGFVFGASAYILWGGFPLYFPLLEPGDAVEILAHRVAWSALTMVLILIASRKVSQLRAIIASPRTRNFLLLAAAVVTANWGTYIYGVNSGHVVEASLGYFINPLVTVLMGVAVLRERLRPWQWVAMGVAGVAVLWLTIDYGKPPWIALVLAFSFGTYGLAKKKANAGAIGSLTFETLVLSPIAIGYLIWLAATGTGHFLGYGVGHSLLLTSTGVVTAVPLMLFGAAATRVPMTVLGLLQYLAPVIQFGLGVLVFQEHMSQARWGGFCLVWVALAIFTAEAMRHRRRQLRLTAEASAL